jgi:hypothetical protein
VVAPEETEHIGYDFRLSERWEEAMSSGLTTATHFEAWGQAVYGVKRTQRSWNPSGLIVLFAISDTRQEWLGWYYFNTTYTTDIIALGSTHEVLGRVDGFA